MSHNKFTVGGVLPDSSGNIAISSLSLSELSNVTLTNVQAGEIVTYDGSNYVNSSVPSGAVEYMLLGQGESADYDTSPASSMAAGSTIYIYDTSPINNITGATLNKTGDWINTFSLPAGSYNILVQTRVKYNGSGYLVAGIKAGTSVKSSLLVIGDNASSYANGASTTINSYLTSSANQTFNFEIIVSSNLLGYDVQSTTISEFTSILIMKLGS